MAQEHQEENSVDPATHTVRRRRGRPQKDDIPGSEPHNQTRRRKVDVEAHENDPFVGQVVSGVLDGKFDAGYMLTVQVGKRGSVLHGVVFEPGLALPISEANDIAPNVMMSKRDEVSLHSARQLPCFSPVRPRKGGALRHWQRHESSMSSKGICTHRVAEDLNAKVQMHLPVDIQRSPKNGSNHVSGNLKQDLQSTVVDDASKDGIQNVQSANASAECSGNIYVPEAGKVGITASDSSKVVHLHEVVSEDKPITELSQFISESNQAAISDGRPAFTDDNMTNNLKEVVSDIKLNTQMSQTTSEAKQTVETFNAGPVSINDNKAAHIHQIISDAKPAAEVFQIKASESKQSAETFDARPVFVSGASDDHSKVLPTVTIQTSEHMTGGVDDAKRAIEASQRKTSESAKTSDAATVFKDGAWGDYGKAPSPVTIESSVKLTEREADAKQVTEVSETKTSMSNIAAGTSDSGPVFKHGASDDSDVFKRGASDDYDKTLPPVSVPSEQITGVADAKPVTEGPQAITSKSKQSAEISDSGPVFTSGASGDHRMVPPPLIVQTSEHITKIAEDLGKARHITELNDDESDVQHSIKLASEDGTAEVAERMKSSVEQKSQVLQLGPESNKPVEFLSKDNASSTKVMPYQLKSDLACSFGASNEVYYTATSETTNSSFQGADAYQGS